MSVKPTKEELQIEIQKGKVCAITTDPAVREICDEDYDQVGKYISDGKIDPNTGNSIQVPIGGKRSKKSKKSSKKSKKLKKRTRKNKRKTQRK
jgi:N-acyl-D-aspartate/D-glutamate deacylase